VGFIIVHGEVSLVIGKFELKHRPLRYLISVFTYYNVVMIFSARCCIQCYGWHYAYITHELVAGS